MTTQESLHEVTVCQQLTQATHHQLTPLLSASQQPSGLSVQAFTRRLLLVCGFDPGYGPDVSHEHFVLMLGSYTAQAWATVVVGAWMRTPGIISLAGNMAPNSVSTCG